MKHTLTAPWSLTVLPHKRLRAWVRDRGGRPVTCAADLPAPEVPAALEGCVTVPATVPGNFELDLFRAGLIPDPFFDTNILSLRRLEDRHLFYVTAFDAPAGYDASVTREDGEAPASLHFEGIDTYADIYVNGVWVTSTDNMFIAFDAPLYDLKPTGNELMVHIRPAMIEAQADHLTVPPSAGAFKYSYASLYARKAPSSFGWDILCRAVSGGIWRQVWLQTPDPLPRLEEVFLYTRGVRLPEDAAANENPTRGFAELNLYYAFRVDEELVLDYEIAVEGQYGDHRFSAREDVWHTSGNLYIAVPDAWLWYPRNAGQPCLYQVTVTLLRGGVPVDSRALNLGIRTVELDRTSLVAADGSGQFRFLINHRPVFVMGTNWVPLDAFHSRDAERLPAALSMLEDIGCNAVRCWGGNVYEDHAFFDFCDSHGILVWQDFAMGCAIYPQDDNLCEALREEVRSVVRKLRGHASLCLWAGDNECDIFWMNCHAFVRNPGENVLTRRIIPEVLRAEDFTRPYLPSSPYIDGEAFAQGGQRTSEDHLWGPRDYFKGDFYRTAPCHFASETGYHGCPAPSSLAKFIPREQLWPIFDAGTAEDPFAGEPRPAWLAHQTSMELNQHNTFGYRIALMTSQVRHMFRDTPPDLYTFARMSQMSQAEAFKYFIERFRTAKWDKTGIIWWNLLDGWPQVSDAVVGYDLLPKLAYSFIKRAQSPVLMAFSDPEDGAHTLHAVNDTGEDLTITYRVVDVTDLDSPEALETAPALLAGTVSVPRNGRVVAARLDLSRTPEHLLSIRWTDSRGQAGASHFLPEPQALAYEPYAKALHICGFDLFEGF